MPLIVLFYPLTSAGIVALSAVIRFVKQVFSSSLELQLILNFFAIVLIIIGGGLTLFSASESLGYLAKYALNVNSVYLQPLQMARWLAANTPEDAVVAVHDVGMMRYIGGRATVDMVGLTTPGAADAWRNGPGAVAEFLERLQPNYMAAYTDAGGLSYVADTGIYGDLLAGFQVEYDERSNVALAGHFQGIYRTDWSVMEHADKVLQPSILNYLDGFELVDRVDVGDLTSEQAHRYSWRNGQNLTGFPT
jgi:hypothetical protein